MNQIYTSTTGGFLMVISSLKWDLHQLYLIHQHLGFPQWTYCRFLQNHSKKKSSLERNVWISVKNKSGGFSNQKKVAYQGSLSGGEYNWYIGGIAEFGKKTGHLVPEPGKCGMSFWKV